MRKAWDKVGAQVAGQGLLKKPRLRTTDFVEVHTKVLVRADRRTKG